MTTAAAMYVKMYYSFNNEEPDTDYVEEVIREWVPWFLEDEYGITEVEEPTEEELNYTLLNR